MSIIKLVLDKTLPHLALGFPFPVRRVVRVVRSMRFLFQLSWNPIQISALQANSVAILQAPFGSLLVLFVSIYKITDTTISTPVSREGNPKKAFYKYKVLQRPRQRQTAEWRAECTGEKEQQGSSLEMRRPSRESGQSTQGSKQHLVRSTRSHSDHAY